LGAWAFAPAVPHGDVAIQHRFERQVEATPEAIALISDGESLTYQELNRLSNILAHHLNELGVGPETIVGLYVERWAHGVIGLLGALKAGGAYLPLDPDHPLERLAAMVEDCGASVLLTEDPLRARLAGGSATVATLESLFRGDGRPPRQEPDPGNPSVPV